MSEKRKMAKLSSKEKTEPGWMKIWKLLKGQSGKDDQIQFLVNATKKIICPETTIEYLKEELMEVKKRCEEEKDEGKRKRIVEHQLGFLVSFIQMEKTTLKMIVERKEQQEEIRKLKEVLAKKEEEERKREEEERKREEQEIERKEEEERQSQLERKKREEQEKEKDDREKESKMMIEKLREKLELAKCELGQQKEERKLCEDKTKILSSLVEGLMQLRVKAIREVGEGKLRTSKQEPPTSTKTLLVPYNQSFPSPALNICSPPRLLTIVSSFSPIMFLFSFLSTSDFLRLAIPNPFLEMSTGMRPPPEPPPLL